MNSALVGLMLLLLMVHPSYAQVATAAGSVTAIAGKVTLTRAGKAMVAAYGTPLQIGDQIATAPASRITVTLADGTQLGLEESGTMVVERNDLNPDGSRAATSINLLDGTLHSLVRHAPGIAPNYQVYTPNASAAARGTDYDTAYRKDADDKKHKGCREYTDVAVREGIVEVTNTRNPSAGSVRLKKDQKTRVGCGYIPEVLSLGGLGVLGLAGVGVTVVGTTGGFGEPTTSSQ